MDDERDDVAFVTVARIWNWSELITYVAMLRAYGIDCYVTGERHASVEPLIVALGGFEVRDV